MQTGNLHALFFQMIVGAVVLAQSPFDSYSSWIKHTPSYIKGGVEYSFTDRSNQLILGITAVAALGAYQYDQKIKTFAQNEGLLPDQVSRMGDLYGGRWANWLLFSSILTTSWLNDEQRDKLLGKLEYAAWAIWFNGTATYLLKWSVGRERPNKADRRSFPSGHTSHSFTIAAVVQELYGPEVGTLAYLTAVIVGISRINDNKHYLSDVLFGAGMGTIIGRGFATQYGNNQTGIIISASNGLLIEIYVLI